MKRFIILSVFTAFAAPVLANEEVLCVSTCQYAPSGPDLRFSCPNPDLAETITLQKYPSNLIEERGTLAVAFSMRNFDMGINVAAPAIATIYYLCAKFEQ